MTDERKLRYILTNEPSQSLFPILERNGFKNPQTFFPLLKFLFRLRDPNRIINSIQLGNRWSIGSMNQENGTITLKNKQTIPFFLKAIPLYDPLQQVQGKQTHKNGTPNLLGTRKISTYFNEAYVETVITQLLQDLPGFPRLYGHFMCLKHDFIYDITDEQDSVKRDTWWRRNKLRNMFSVIPEHLEEDNVMEIGDGMEELGDGTGNIPIVDVDTFTAVEIGDLDELEELGDATFGGGDGDRGSVTSLGVLSLDDLEEHEEEPNNDEGGSGDGDSDSEDYSDTESDEEEEAQIIIPKMPTQCMILENLTHKVDDHLEKEPIKEEEWRSILFQVIVILQNAQMRYGFTHNDLHTNNLMYVETKRRWLDFEIGGTMYRIPSFGRLVRIIDFGRAIMKIPGTDRWLIPDCQKQPQGVAAGMYNFGPQRDMAKPEILPNASFDLARLASSMVECLCPEFDGGEEYPELAGLLREWTTQVEPDTGIQKNFLQDDRGKSLNNDFTLQEEIAKKARGLEPARQVRNPFFAKYELAV